MHKDGKVTIGVTPCPCGSGLAVLDISSGGIGTCPACRQVDGTKQASERSPMGAIREAMEPVEG